MFELVKAKLEVHPTTGPQRGSRDTSLLFLQPRRFIPRTDAVPKESGWVPRPFRTDVEYLAPLPRDSNPGPSSPLISRYTDWSIPAHQFIILHPIYDPGVATMRPRTLVALTSRISTTPLSCSFKSKQNITQVTRSHTTNWKIPARDCLLSSTRMWLFPVQICSFLRVF
jgi:hypothetical protein